MSMRTIAELRKEYEKEVSGIAFDVWLRQQPEGDPTGGVAQKNEFPTVATQAKNLVRSVGQHVKAGFKRTDDALLAERLKLCDECGGETMRRTGRCLHCGCFMKVKAAWTEQKCPIGKW